MVTKILSWCIMNIYQIIFYINICIYIYYRSISGNTEMINYSFHSVVLLGFLALLNKK